MAIYHLSIKPVSRAAGRSATAAAAYRAATRIEDGASGDVFDYRRKRGVEHTEIVLPTSAVQRDIQWPRDRATLWNAAESAESRKDARVAREYEVALPHELTQRQRLELVREFSQELADRYGVAVDFAIHKPHREADMRNHHAHVLTTTRQIEAIGLGAKSAIEWADTDRAKRGLKPAKEEIAEIRERWATLTNAALDAGQHETRVDHRSLQSQGLDRPPTSHVGPAVAGMERRGIETEVGARIRAKQHADAQARLDRAAEFVRLERESKHLASSIIDTSRDLKAAVTTRDAERTRSLDQIRLDSRAAWLVQRDEQGRAVASNTHTSTAASTNGVRTLDLTGDIAAARRDARERWLAQRNEPGPESNRPGVDAKPPSKIWFEEHDSEMQ